MSTSTGTHRSPDGSLFFDETGETLGPLTSPETFDATDLRKRGALYLSPDRSTCKLAERLIFGAPFHVTLTFVGPRLRNVDLFPNRPDDAKGWSGWTHQTEMARKAWAEEWASQLFGKPLSIKPFALPDSTEVVYPASPGPEHPRHALFDWGEVCSYFDSKGGFAGLWICYTHPDS